VARHRSRFCDADQDQLDRLTEGLMKKIFHPAMGKIRDWSGKEELGALRIDTIYELFELPRRKDLAEPAQPDQDAEDEEAQG
ncbi:MAG: hypothetical protein V3V11_06225, partial [Vicinamibacteria bacterium]